MAERLSQQEVQETEQQEWQLLSEMPQRDYWVGATYNDAYRSRLELNIHRFESICRQLDLPPLEITSVSYTPPAEEYPEMVGYGLAGWKKAILGKPESQNDPQSDYEIQSMPEITPLSFPNGLLPIPLGWKLGVKGRKIEREIARINHNLSKDEEEILFADKFNDALWKGLRLIHAHEWSDTRAFGLNSQNRKNSIAIMGSMISAPLTPVLIEQLTSIDFSVWESLGVTLGSSSPLQISFYEAVRRWAEGNIQEDVDMRNKGRVSMLLSNSWRYDRYPERYVREKHGMPKLSEVSIHGIPYVGLAMERDLKYSIVKYQNNNQPLVRLRE